MAIAGYLAFAFAAGVMLPIQFGINAQLANWIGSSLRASLVSFAVGTLALLAATLVAARSLPSAAQLGEAPRWVWLGGLFGAFYVLGSVVTAPQLRAVTLVALILMAQAVSSLLVDHFGWVGFEQHPITAGRVAGVALLAAGVALVRVF